MLNDAVRGRKVPSYDTARAIVESCGERWPEWQPLWFAAVQQANARKLERRLATQAEKATRMPASPNGSCVSAGDSVDALALSAAVR
jgi:hypothetical protein